jgi:hypothetical protein
MPKKISKQSFGATDILLVVVLLAVVGFGGWAVYHQNHTKSTELTSTTNESLGSDKAAFASPSVPPVLGKASVPTQHGYGTTTPLIIDNGGDPTGILSNITWHSWGGSRATGTGTSDYVAGSATVASGIQAQATVVVFNLGVCHGKPSYNAVEWYFPQYGQSFNSNRYINTCTGQHVGN